MAELMKDSLDFTMRQQRRCVTHRRRQISADQAQVRLPMCGIARYQRVHPGAPALVLPWEPVRVEAAQKLSRACVFYPVVAHGWIPTRNSRLGDYVNPENTAENIEHACHHAFQLEVRPQFFFIEVVKRETLFFGNIPDVPGLDF